jgi:ankyrin repeat protein
LFEASCKGECDVVKCLLSSSADINLRDENGQSPLFTASMHGNNGDLPSWSHKLISAPELSKHLTTSHSPLHDAINNGDCPFM